MTLELSDALLTTAECVIALGKKSGVELKLSQVYNKDTVEHLALISGFLRELAEKGGNCKIDIVNE